MDRNNVCHEFLLFYLGHSISHAEVKVSELRVSSIGEKPIQ